LADTGLLNELKHGASYMPKVREKHIRGLVKRHKRTAQIVAKGRAYEHLSTGKNPKYEAGLKDLPFESCLIHNKCNKTGKVRTAPKWLTTLAVFESDSEGYPIISGHYETDDFKASNHRKIKALDKFCSYYQPLYKQKEVTLFFLTFTQLNKAKLPWKIMIKVIREYFKRIGFPIRGFIWTLEVSENLHAHYHIAIAVDRMELKGKSIPELIKFDNIWGRRTEIDFVKKNIRHYMSKYFAKHNYRIEGYRSYGKSAKYR
jgi:hypothetical protein